MILYGCSSKLQLLEWVSSEAVTSILHKLIEQRMEQHCRGEYERSFLLEFQKVKTSVCSKCWSVSSFMKSCQDKLFISCWLSCVFILSGFFVCEQWLELVLGWLSKVFTSKVHTDGSVPSPSAPSVQASQSASSILKQWRCHMHQFFCRIYVNMRIEELFSIIRGARKKSAYFISKYPSMFLKWLEWE